MYMIFLIKNVSAIDREWALVERWPRQINYEEL